jgi:hypothetical protein
MKKDNKEVHGFTQWDDRNTTEKMYVFFFDRKKYFLGLDISLKFFIGFICSSVIACYLLGDP